MFDLAYIVLVVVFCALAIAYARVAPRLYGKRRVNTAYLVLGLVAAVLLLYLLYALMRPEKF